MNSQDLTRKWAQKTLEERDIFWYLVENIRAMHFHEERAIWHVARCLLEIYLWSTGQLEHLDGFMVSVVQNNLTDAVHKADEINRLALWLYPAYLYNCAPAGWDKKK